MSQNEIYAEWERLCEEHEKVREAYMKVFACVNREFAAIGQGVSNENPSDRGLSEFDETWKACEDIKNRTH